LCWYVKKGAKGHFKAKDVTPNNFQNSAFIPSVEFTELRLKYVNFVCWHDVKRHDDPIFLVSNFQHLGDIIAFYDPRYSTECLFKDLKSTSFYLDKTRLKKVEEVNNLVIIAALAFYA
jgi:hypothetical protein